MPAGQKPSSATTNSGLFFSSFDLPLTPEALAVRFRKNLANFAGSYLLFWWVGLAISLVPWWRTSKQSLLLMTLVFDSYVAGWMLKPDAKFPHGDSVVLILLFAFAVACTVTLVFMEAKIHLLLSLAIGAPGVLLHAILRRDDLDSTIS